jgi:hypothetical protein
VFVPPALPPPARTVTVALGTPKRSLSSSSNPLPTVICATRRYEYSTTKTVKPEGSA